MKRFKSSDSRRPTSPPAGKSTSVIHFGNPLRKSTSVDLTHLRLSLTDISEEGGQPPSAFLNSTHDEFSQDSETPGILSRGLTVLTRGAMSKDPGAESPRSSLSRQPSEDVSAFDTASIFAQMSQPALVVPFCGAIADSPAAQYSIRPDNSGRLIWDCFVLNLVLYSSFSQPFQVAFVESSGFDWVDFLVDLMFYADIVITFFTGFDRGFGVEMNRREIAANYIGSWFFIDVVATVQWDLVVGMVTDDEAVTGSMYIRMLGMLRVLRLAQAGRLISRLTSRRAVHTDYIDALKFFMYVTVVAHLLACFFYLWPMLSTCDEDEHSADEAFAVPDETTLGWHWKDNCMQNSWRQKYGLEVTCDSVGNMLAAGTPSGDLQLRVCQESTQFDHRPGTSQSWSLGRVGTSPETLCDSYATEATGSCPYNRSFVAQRCTKCLGPYRRYIDALYWSVTTMTTIGYGDRGPQTREELIFVMFAEVFGLAFFALLIQQIAALNKTMGKSRDEINERKNKLVAFLKSNNCTRFDERLIKETVRFLNFRSTVLSGHSFDASSEVFDGLSPGLRDRINIAVNRPVLEKIRLFGWNPIDFDEEKQLRHLFDSIDTAQDGVLHEKEMQSLFMKEKIDVTAGQFKKCFTEMDYRNTGEIDYFEFRRWWYTKKYGEWMLLNLSPHILRCGDWICLLTVLS